jgi:hypothetical protein
MYFVTLTTHEDKPVIEVQRDNDSVERFPLTKDGCLDAGAFMAKEKQDQWLCSSTVDFPKETKKGFRHNVHQLMKQGCQDGQF